jgi:hypothetical protein
MGNLQRSCGSVRIFVCLDAADMMMILDGVDLGSVRRRRRYSRDAAQIPGRPLFEVRLDCRIMA